MEFWLNDEYDITEWNGYRESKTDHRVAAWLVDSKYFPFENRKISPFTTFTLDPPDDATSYFGDASICARHPWIGTDAPDDDYNDLFLHYFWYPLLEPSYTFKPIDLMLLGNSPDV